MNKKKKPPIMVASSVAAGIVGGKELLESAVHGDFYVLSDFVFPHSLDVIRFSQALNPVTQIPKHRIHLQFHYTQPI
jgi:hypothetical protein